MTHHNKVIVLPKPKAEPALWRFFGIQYPNLNRPLDDWYRDDLSDEARFSLVDALKDARVIENPTNWICFKRYMKGELRKYKVMEIWFDCGDKREYRLLGVVGSERKQMIFLIGCYHKGHVYTPTGALGTAVKRAKDLSEKKVTIYERKLPTR